MSILGSRKIAIEYFFIDKIVVAKSDKEQRKICRIGVKILTL